MKPTVFLLCGLPFSGKTTYAKKLEKNGPVRITLDEALFKRFGRHFKTGYSKKEEKTKKQLRKEAEKYVRNKKSVIFDFGFWKKETRDEYKVFAENIGARWRLLYFPVPKGELEKRLKIRNKRDLETNHLINKELLNKFIKQFEVPQNEGEEVVNNI